MEKFKQDGFYAVQNFVSYGSIERIIQVTNGFVMKEKSDWVPVEQYFDGMGEIEVVHLESFDYPKPIYPK
jgi:hypothetical protein